MVGYPTAAGEVGQQVVDAADLLKLVHLLGDVVRGAGEELALIQKVPVQLHVGGRLFTRVHVEPQGL